MRNIVKGSEPKCLAAHRRTPHAGYDNLPGKCKDELKRRMWREQGGLCCYCMSRVTADGGHIEHWHPQSKGSSGGNAALAYTNMFLVCDGGTNGSGNALHCDASKSDQSLKFNPANPRHGVEARIRYLANGKIECRDDVEFDDQLQEVLNLNAPYLVRARAKVIEETRKRSCGRGTSELNEMRKRFSQSKSSDGMLPQFCMAAVYFIDKQIQKAAYRKNAGRN